MAVADSPLHYLLQAQLGPPALALSQHILKMAEAVPCLCPLTHEETVRVMEMLTPMVGQACHTLEETQRIGLNFNLLLGLGPSS